jgi:hypothetical protein
MQIERWEKAIAKAKVILEQYSNLEDEFTYSWVIDSIKGYLYLADVWNRQSPAVITWLEELTFDPPKWRDRRPFGKKHGKAGHDMID